MEQITPTALGCEPFSDDSDRLPAETAQAHDRIALNEDIEIKDHAALVLRCLRCSVSQAIFAKRAPDRTVATADIARCSGLTHRQVLNVVQDRPDVVIAQRDDRIVASPGDLFEIPTNDDFCWTPNEPEANVFAPLARRDFQPSPILSTSAGLRSIYSSYNSDHRILDSREEAELSEIIRNPDSNSRAVDEAVHTLITHNVRLAYTVVHRSQLHRQFLTFDEAMSSAMAAVGRAAANFDHTRAKFSTYAIAAAENSIQREAAAGAGIPPSYYQYLPRLNVGMADFKQVHGRLPNPLELSLVTSMSVVTILRTKAACSLLTDRVLLDQPLQNTRPPMHGEQETHDRIGNADSAYDEIEVLDVTDKLNKTLSDYGKTVLDCMLSLPPPEAALSISRQFKTVPAKAKRDIAHIASLLRHPYYGVASDIPGNEWQEEAACVTNNDDRVVSDTAWISDVQARCAECPVVKECYDLARRGQAVTTATWGGKPAAYFKKYH